MHQSSESTSVNVENFQDAIRIGAYLGWTDLRQAYKRTLIGQFWISLSTLVGIAAIGTVYSYLFGIAPSTYLPYLATGLVFWGLINSAITEGAVAFIFSEGYIRGTAVPHLTYIVRIMSKMLLTFAHNLIVIPIVLLIFPQGFSPTVLLVIPGFLIGVLALTGIVTTIAVFATRFRDVPQILAALMTILFYVTPVIWKPSTLPDGPAQLVVYANPLASVLQVMRLPVLNESPDPLNWVIASLTALISLSIGAVVFSKFDKRIAFWV